ncbi:MAG: cysteine hydrolase [Balneolaceae bacterium]|nr:cysteine hydrolase [Balneolaceae bacterium]
MKLRSKNPALIFIDFQKGFEEESYWGGNRNNRHAEENALAILERWRALYLPIFHVRHSSQNADSRLHKSNPGFQFKDHFEPKNKELLITKKVNSAFIGTNLKQKLDKNKIHTIVIAGLTTNHCVSTTTRMAGNYGYETILISDATATFNRVGIDGKTYSSELIHATSLASLNNEFADIISTKQLLKKI